MAKLRFFFSATEKDIIITLDGAADTLTVGDTALCIDGNIEIGTFGADRELALKAAKGFVENDYARVGELLFMCNGRALNHVPTELNYELIYTVEA